MEPNLNLGDLNRELEGFSTLLQKPDFRNNWKINYDILHIKCLYLFDKLGYNILAQALLNDGVFNKHFESGTPPPKGLFTQHREILKFIAESEGKKPRKAKVY